MVFSTPHTATLRARRQQFTLGYDTGTAAFTAGKTLTGALSGATAVIVSTGSTASGTLTLHTISGTFADDEAISDNGTVPGAATVNGVIAEKFDGNGELVYSDVDVTIACRFYAQKDAIQQAGQTLYIVTTQRVMIPDSATPTNGDQIITTSTGYAGTYTIGNVSPAPGLAGGPHHWTCDIAKAGV